MEFALLASSRGTTQRLSVPPHARRAGGRPFAEWISQNDEVRKGRVACPADMLSNEQANGLRRCGVEIYVEKDAFDDIWNGRPALPHGSVDVFPRKVCW